MLERAEISQHPKSQKLGKVITTMLRALLNDEAGFIVSAELVLVATLCVIGLIVGLSEVQHAVVQELNDVAEAIGELNQSYIFTGFTSTKSAGGTAVTVKASTPGSDYSDLLDECDKNECTLSCTAPADEAPKP
jgi:Flp pilus assembly pilin Flp